MSLSDEERYALVEYRIEKAQATLEQAKSVIPLGYWEMTANRLYYAVYYAVSALLLQHGYSVQTHNGIVQMFNMHFVKTGKVDKHYGTLYSQLFALRQTGDYGDLLGLTAEQVMPLVPQADDFVAIMTAMVKSENSTLEASI